MREVSETSYGVIPLKVTENQKLEVFLVLHKNGEFWGFPKGHAEKSDADNKATAQRELFEETHLKVLRFLELEPFNSYYEYQKSSELLVKKSTVFFAALTTQHFEIDKSEVLDAKWVSLSEGLALISYDEGKALMKSVIEKLENLKI